VEFDYKTRRGRVRIYGGKIIENVCQAIARCIIGEQMLQIAKRYRVVLTVHDSIACCVKDEEVDEAQEYIEECMRQPPEWAEGLPIDCESGKGKSYGECE
jgi:DNA polymerase